MRTWYMTTSQLNRQRWSLKTKAPYIVIFWGRQLIWQKCTKWCPCRLPHLNITNEFSIHSCHGSQYILFYAQALSQQAKDSDKRVDDELRPDLFLLGASLLSFHMCARAPGLHMGAQARGICWFRGAESRTNQAGPSEHEATDLS